MSIRLNRMLCGLLCIAFLGTFSVNANAANANMSPYISVIGFDKDVDYSKLMWQCATDGSPYALKVGAVYEQQRNLKIERLGMKYEKTSYFADYHTGKYILAAMKTGPKITRLKSEHRSGHSRKHDGRVRWTNSRIAMGYLRRWRFLLWPLSMESLL